MKTYLAFFITALIAAIILTPWARNLGIRFGILDRPNRRKVHQVEIPRSGGLAILAATILPFLGFLFYGNLLLEQIRLFWQPLTGLILGSLLVFGVGFLDDLYRLSPWPKLGAEVAASFLAVALDLKIQISPDLLGLPFDLSWLSYPLTIFWLVGITNAVNLADGVDGLAAGIATFAAIILFFMTFNTIHNVVALLAIALAGATLGFLRYNFYPATIFLGDAGSLFLGFYLGALSIWASEISTITFSLLIPMVALGLPMADMVYAVLRRWSRGLPLEQADREHIHHKLLDMGFGQLVTVLILYGVNILLIVFAAILLLTRNSLAAYILVLLGLALVLGSRVLGYFRFSRIISKFRQRWRDIHQTKYITFRSHLLNQAFQREKNLFSRWTLAQELFPKIGFIRVQFLPLASEIPLLEWSESGETAPPSSLPQRASYLEVSLWGGSIPLGAMKFFWNLDGDPLPAGLNKFLTVMVREFGKNLTGIESQPPQPGQTESKD
ncbi:MAG: undecaprenyl/decaprenyl-phosphate alpha-N-acetylglucosaminyl 1-phosphate transferase [Deltaproteobacteria bacterium]|nr:undecaprenyl/decaprenyl-phosphate alpha-N-acetylglucosaminyl 1-phosphate transferase [Deltaproteobacteria bacterium]